MFLFFLDFWSLKIPGILFMTNTVKIGSQLGQFSMALMSIYHSRITKVCKRKLFQAHTFTPDLHRPQGMWLSQQECGRGTWTRWERAPVGSVGLLALTGPWHPVMVITGAQRRHVVGLCWALFMAPAPWYCWVPRSIWWDMENNVTKTSFEKLTPGHGIWEIRGGI